MTITTSSSEIEVATLGSVGPFQFPFVGVAASDIVVSSIATNNVLTPLLTSQYTLNLNTANPNQLWGVGGTVTLTSALSTGVSLIIQRILPLTQTTSVQNQGNYFAQVTEQALDVLEMQIQQLAARTTQFRGIWVTNIVYNFGDIVQDGANGANTSNYYICNNANTSGVWATDLAAGDWAISVTATVPSSSITLTGDVTGAGTGMVITSIANNAVTTAKINNSAVTNAKIASMPANTVLCNPSAVSAAPSTIALAASTLLGMGSSGNIAQISLGTNLSMAGTVLVATQNNLNFRSTSQLDVTSSITGNVVPGLSTTLVSGLSYLFEGHITGTASASGGSKIAMGGTAGASNFTMTAQNYNGVTLNGQSTTTSLTNGLGNTATMTDIYYVGEISVATGGTFIVSLAQNVATSVSTSAYVGSTLRMQQTSN